MLLVDPRKGSGDLVEPFKRIGIPAVAHQMAFGDCAFVGNGPGGGVIQVGVEVKKIPDLVDCIVSGRLAGHQLVGLVEAYDERWLVVEGAWRVSQAGVLEIKDPKKHFWFPIRSRGRGWMFREVMGYMLTLSIIGGLKIWHTYDRDETVRFVGCLYRWWTEKAYHEHKSLKTFVDYKGRVVADSKEPRDVRLGRPTPFRRLVKEFPQIGWERSVDVERLFGGDITKLGLALAFPDETDWMIPGVVQQKRAKGIVRTIKTNRDAK